MAQTALLIGLPEACRRLAGQLEQLADAPRVLGCVIPAQAPQRIDDPAPLGTVDQLELIAARHRPDLALVTFPAAMTRLITTVRTQLRRIGIPDRFMPTLEDQLHGIGPRTHLDIEVGELLDRPGRAVDEGAIRAAVDYRRVLITGAGGTIGGELARIVARYRPQQIVLVERSENALFEIDRQLARIAPGLPRVALLHDVVDAAETRAHFQRLEPQVIFHAAAHKHVPMMEDHPAAAVDNNFYGTKSVADAAHAIESERLVMISTDKAVRPRSIMGATKRLAELYIQHLAQESTTLFSMVRFGNVLGSSGSVLDIWARQLAEGGPMTVTDPAMTRYFMTVGEAASLVIQSSVLIERVVSGSVFVLDMGKPVKVFDLARRFAQLHGLETAIDESGFSPDAPGHVRIVYTGIRPGEKLHEQLAVDANALRPTGHPDIHCLELEPPDEGLIKQLLAKLDPRGRPTEASAVAEIVRGLIKQPALTTA